MFARLSNCKQIVFDWWSVMLLGLHYGGKQSKTKKEILIGRMRWALFWSFIFYLLKSTEQKHNSNTSIILCWLFSTTWTPARLYFGVAHGKSGKHKRSQKINTVSVGYLSKKLFICKVFRQGWSYRQTTWPYWPMESSYIHSNFPWNTLHFYY